MNPEEYERTTLGALRAIGATPALVIRVSRLFARVARLEAENQQLRQQLAEALNVPVPSGNAAPIWKQ